MLKREQNEIIQHFFCLVLITSSVFGQRSLSSSAIAVFGTAKVKDNWTPSTAPNYHEFINGSSFGYGLNINYSFRPNFIFKDKYKGLAMQIGIGYFKQEFDVKRPFDYSSMIYIIYRTRNYVYHNCCWTAGLTYSYPLKNKYSIIANLTYTQLNSFQQVYKPTSGDPAQVNKHSIDFGKMVILSIGVNKRIGDKISVGLNLLLPYSRWRNDKIYRDNPSTFSFLGVSLGSSVSVLYYL